MSRIVDDERIRRTVTQAHAQGLPQTKIAELTGLSRDIVREIVTGKPHHPCKTKIRVHNYSTYKNHGCRCSVCSAAAVEYRNTSRHRSAHRRPLSLNQGFMPLMDRIIDPWSDPTADAAISRLGEGE